jgi:hypothetical protein
LQPLVVNHWIILRYLFLYSSNSFAQWPVRENYMLIHEALIDKTRQKKKKNRFCFVITSWNFRHFIGLTFILSAKVVSILIYHHSFFAQINVNRMFILRWDFFLRVRVKSVSTYHIARGWRRQTSENATLSDREVDTTAKRYSIL